MDPLSVGASVLAFIGLADRIIRATRYCIDSVQNAPSDMRLIFCEVSSLRTIIDIVTASVQPPSSGEGAAGDVVRKVPLNWAGPIEACRRCLASLGALLPTDSARQMGPLHPNGEG